MNQSAEEFNNELTQAFANQLGACQVVGSRAQFPLVMRHVKQYSGSGWLLMGDAAHTVHPLAGFGLNVGLQDLSVWLTNENPLGSAKAFGAYQRERKTAVWQTIMLLDALKWIFANPLPPIAALRSLGLAALNRISPLKRLIIAHACDGS